MAPSKARRKRSLRQIDATVVARASTSSNPSPSSVKEDEIEWVLEPNIPPLSSNTEIIVPQQGLGFEVVEGRLEPSHTREYKPNGKSFEGNAPIYAIGFNYMDINYYDVFATTSSNRVTVYRCLENGSFGVLQAYVDEEKDESLYTLSWTSDVYGSPLLVAAGRNGIIRVISCATEKLVKSLVGHGGAINEIRTQAQEPSLIISASKDESVRLWNVHNGICILIFAGAGGHCHEVLSVDFHPSNKELFASCGMDKTVKIWSMKEFSIYVDKSCSWTGHASEFPTRYVQYPILTVKVHYNFVDCTRWLGDFILSKSVDNEILLWEPKINEQSPKEGSIDVFQKYPVPECKLWFMKFSCDFHFNQLAIGNDKGEIFVWEVQSSPPVLIDRLCNPQCKSSIRQTAVSFDGSTILGAGDDGAIWRWDAMDLISQAPKKASETAMVAEGNA